MRSSTLSSSSLIRAFASSNSKIVGNICHLKQNEELFFALIIGMNEGFAKILLSDLQAHMMSNELFIKDFGMQYSYGDWADGEFETLDGKHFKALGINQPFRGLRFGANRFDFAILDDIEDRDRAKRPDMVRKFGEKITGDLVKGFHRKRGRLLVNNNYIVKDGILDFLKEQWQDSPHFHESITNLATENITRENYKDIDWEPSWPERDSKADIIRRLMGIKYPYGLHRGYFCPLIGLFFTHIKEASFPLFGYFVLSYFSDLFTLIPFIHRLFRAFLHYYYFRYFVLLPINFRITLILIQIKNDFF